MAQSDKGASSARGNGAAKADTPQKTTVPKPKATGPVMYLGPNHPEGMLWHGQVCKNGLPPTAADLIGRVPGADALFVPLAEIPKAKLALADRTSNLSRLYRALAEAQGG